MIILILGVVLSGSVAGASVLWLQGAPWWYIALGYVGGGWAGLLAGLPIILAGKWLWQAIHVRQGQDRPGIAAWARELGRNRDGR